MSNQDFFAASVNARRAVLQREARAARVARLALRAGRRKAHAAMAGRTAMVVGRWHGRFVHLPIALATESRNQVDPDGDWWMSVLEATGQPPRFGRREVQLPEGRSPLTPSMAAG